MAEKKQAITRRSFFAGIGLVTAAGAVVKLGAPAALVASVPTAALEPEGSGYRLTEHVKKYYRSTIL
jgi:hypothetical protein